MGIWFIFSVEFALGHLWIISGSLVDLCSSISFVFFRCLGMQVFGQLVSKLSVRHKWENAIPTFSCSSSYLHQCLVFHQVIIIKNKQIPNFFSKRCQNYFSFTFLFSNSLEGFPSLSYILLAVGKHLFIMMFFIDVAQMYFCFSQLVAVQFYISFPNGVGLRESCFLTSFRN